MTPQEPDPDLPVCDQESPAEAWVGGGLQQATPDLCLCWRFLDTHWQVWVRLLWGHCAFLLGPEAYRVLFVPS